MPALRRFLLLLPPAALLSGVGEFAACPLRAGGLELECTQRRGEQLASSQHPRRRLADATPGLCNWRVQKMGEGFGVSRSDHDLHTMLTTAKKALNEGQEKHKQATLRQHEL